MWLTLNHILNRGILMLCSILLAKYMIPADFSLYSYYQITVTMIASYASLGLGLVASKFYAEYSINEKHDDSNIRNLSIICFYAAILISIVIYFLPKDIIIKEFDIPTYIISITVMFLVLNIVPTGALMGLEKYKKLTIISTGSSFFLFIGVILSIQLSKIIYSIYFYMLYLVIQYFGCRVLIYKISPINFNFRVDFNKLKNISGFIGSMFIVSIISAFSTWFLGSKILDTLGNINFSVYAIGLQWFALALFLPGMISRVILPIVIRNKDIGIDRYVLKKSCYIAISFSFLMCLSFLFFIDYIIDFYGEAYNEYKFFLILFVFVSIFYAPANTLGNALIAKVGSNVWLKITILWFVILLSVFFLTLQDFGLYSIVYSHGFSSFFMLICTYIICNRKGII